MLLHAVRLFNPYMKRAAYHFSVALLVASLSACSKNDASAPPTETASTPEAIPATTNQQPPPATAAVSVGQLENHIGTALQQQNYDVAVDSLAQVNPASQNLTEAQRLQYAQQLQRTLAALAQAKETDPKAKAAYERLGRVATGR